MPKVEPKFRAPFLGFTKTAETWNSRACMIGLIGTFIVELVSYFFSFELNCLLAIVNQKMFSFSFFFSFLPVTNCGVVFSQIIKKGILQIIGVDIGKGLDIPL